MKKRKPKLGFKQAFEYLLDVLCYGYYVKHNTLISDQAFDELEKLYCKTFNESHAPSRAMESEVCYSTGVKVVYDLIVGDKNDKL